MAGLKTSDALHLAGYLLGTLLGVAGLAGCRQPPMPQPIHRASAVISDERIVTLSTESEEVRNSWQIRPLDPTIRIAGKQIVIEPGQIVVDGQDVADLPSGTKKIEVAERNGRVNIVADGTKICDF